MAAAARGIPTRYRGTLFRSRLESRWAAFFDLVGWSWSYEPVSIKSTDHSYRCLVNGCYDGARHVGQLEPGELAEKWTAAGNRVQWRGLDNEECVRGVR